MSLGGHPLPTGLSRGALGLMMGGGWEAPPRTPVSLFDPMWELFLRNGCLV